MRLHFLLFFLLAGLCAPLSLAQQQQPAAPLSPVSTTVVVLGNPEAVNVGESDRSVTVIDTKAHPLAFQTVEGYLRTDPSTFIEQRGAGGAQADISIRGTSFEQTLVLLNGLRINDAETAHNNLDIPVTMDALRSIDVLHGAGSTLYGTDAIGGVVDFVTAEPTATSLRLRTGVGSFGENDQMAIASIAKHTWSEMATGERDFSSGFIYDRDYRTEEASSESRLKTQAGETDVLAAGSDRAFGANDFYGNYPSWEHTKGWFASINQELGAKTDAAFGYRRHTDEYVLFRNDPAIYENNHIDTSWQGVLRRKDTLGAKTALFYGLEGDGDGIHSNNLGVHARNWGAGYLDATASPAQGMTVSAGLRQEIISGGYDVTSPMLAAGYFVAPRIKLRGEAGYGFRLPTYLDLYYSDPSTVGNANLKPESAWNFEGGADWFATARLYVTATVFYSRQHDAIDYLRANANDKWMASNLSGLRFTGVESHAVWAPAHNQQVKLGWTALWGAQNALHGLQSEYVFNYPVNNATAEWSATVKQQYMLDTRLQVVERYQQDPYAVWNVSLAREAGRVHPYVQMTNLTNTGYQEVIGVPMPGRAFTGGLEWMLGR